MGVCGEGMHTHPDHVTIVLVGGRAKIVKPDKEPMIVERKARRRCSGIQAVRT